MILQNKDKKEKVEGYKVRWQFFGPFLYLFLFMCIGWVYGLLVTMIGRNTPEEILESLYIAIYMFGMVIVPFSVLAIINRFIGITVCVLNENGINYKGRLIKWKDITKVEYEFEIPMGRPSSGQCNCATVFTKDDEIEIRHAPFYMLYKIKKYRPDIKVGYTKWSRNFLIAVTVIALVLPVILVCIPE